MITPLYTRDTFQIRVEEIVKNESVSFTEAIIILCDDHGIEYEDIVPLIPPPMIAKLEAEARSKNILPRLNSLSDFIE